MVEGRKRGTISAGFTAFYSLRLISLTFLTYPNANKHTYLSTHDAPVIVMVPLTILSILAIFFGYCARDLFVGMGTDFLSTSLFIHPNHISLVEAEFSLPTLIKLLPAILTIFGASLSLYLYHKASDFTIQLTSQQSSGGLGLQGKTFYQFFNGKYYVDVIYNHYIIRQSLLVGYAISKIFDRGLIELVGPYGFSTSLSCGSHTIAKLDTGSLTSYALYFMISFLLVTLLLFSSILFPGVSLDPRLLLIFIVAPLLLFLLFPYK